MRGGGSARGLLSVLEERDRQNQKWGEQNHRDGTAHDATLFGQPVARMLPIVQAENDAAAHKITWVNILLEEVLEAAIESDVDRLRAEVVQVAAVALQWVQAIDRRGDAL